MPRSWSAKFRDAFRGVWLAASRERSFAVHLPVAGAVVAAGALLRVTLVEWCLLILAIATVLTAETFNTALEHLSRAVDQDENQEIGRALDMASGAVLLTAIGAAAVGTLVLGFRAGVMLQWWQAA
jgi:diacylglycerol kinase (ATP)